MKTSLLALAVLAATVPFAAAAQQAPGALNYNYVEAGYAHTNGDGDAKADGFGANASVALTPNVHLFGGWNSQEIDNTPVDVDHWRIGAGYNHALSPRADLVARAAFERYDVSHGGGKVDGYSVEVGSRGMLATNLEGYAFAGYEDSKDFEGDFYGRLGANYAFTPNWSVTGDVKFADGANQWFVGPRFSW
ncbi:MAG: diffusible signal factor-reguated Ax21 family protein [Pseudoxanthomonas suwonensis]|nr:diffusible signal factor-reguated Ax21 family protein [Pseudoxanthomonas suwonensis]